MYPKWGQIIQPEDIEYFRWPKTYETMGIYLAELARISWHSARNHLHPNVLIVRSYGKKADK